MKWYKCDIRDLTDAEYNKWYSLMREEKQWRVDRFRFADDKKRTVAGEMLARKAIAERCNTFPEQIHFLAKESGKPYAKGLSVEFNISHSADMVVCAVDSNPIGIDIEKIRPVDLSIVKRICSSEEMCYLFGHETDEQNFVYTTDFEILTRFFEIWTIKEAYIKCRGYIIELQAINSHQCRKNCIFLNIKGYICCIYHGQSIK